MKYIDLVPLLTGSVGAFTGWFFTRKKQAAEAENLEIDNSDKIIDQYKTALDDLCIRYENKYEELSKACDRKVKILEDEIRVHKRRYTLLKQENTELRIQLKKYKNTI